MEYQKMLIGNSPYHVALCDMGTIKEHRHPEIELCYCVEGSFTYRIDKTNYTLQKNDLAVIGSMICHEVPFHEESQLLTLTIEVSPILLMELFEPFSKAVFHHPVFSLEDYDPRLKELLAETVDLCQQRTSLTELLIKGNLYKICYYVYKEFIKKGFCEHKSKDFRDIAKIELAIEMIHNHYPEQLTIQQMASICQYSESNFCKIFKRITGDTFHSVLNRCRIKNACCLLKETNDSIVEIAQQVGFMDVKTFCRVFKKYTSYTPSTYRRDNTISLMDLHI